MVCFGYDKGVNLKKINLALWEFKLQVKFNDKTISDSSPLFTDLIIRWNIIGTEIQLNVLIRDSIDIHRYYHLKKKRKFPYNGQNQPYQLYLNLLNYC